MNSKNQKISVFAAISGKTLMDYFCTAIKKSTTVEVTKFTIKTSPSKLSIGVEPDVLLIDVDSWIKNLNGLQNVYTTLNILVITSYEEAFINNGDIFAKEFVRVDSFNKKSTDDKKLGFGFISNKAQQDVIVKAIEAVAKGNSYRYNIDRPYIPVHSKWANVNARTTLKKIQNDNPLDKIAKLSEIIDLYEDKRIEIINGLSVAERGQLDPEFKNKLIDHLIIKGYFNWEIFEILNKDIEDTNVIKENLQTVRTNRTSLTHRLNWHDSMGAMTSIDGKNVVPMNDRERKYLRLIAAGYTNDDISYEFQVDIETVKTNRRKLKEKFNDNAIIPIERETTETSILMIMHALRTGLIDMDDIEYYRNIAIANQKERREWIEEGKIKKKISRALKKGLIETEEVEYYHTIKKNEKERRKWIEKLDEKIEKEKEETKKLNKKNSKQ